MDESDENEAGSETQRERPPDPTTGQVRIIGAEPASTVAAGSGRPRASGTDRDPMERSGLSFLREGDDPLEDLLERPDELPLLRTRPEDQAEHRAVTTSHGSSDEAPGRGDAAASAAVPVLPHWTEPPTGEVPAVLDRRAEGDRDPWPTDPGPAWRGHHDEWDDTGFEPASLGDEETRVGAMGDVPAERRRPWEFDDMTTGPVPPVGRADEPASTHEDGDVEDAAGARGGARDDTARSHRRVGDETTERVAVESAAVGHIAAEPVATEGSAVGGGAERRRADAGEGRVHVGGSDDADEEVRSISSSPIRGEGEPAPVSSRPPHRRHHDAPASGPGRPGRDVPLAIATGVGVAGVALACFALGTVASLVLATVVVTLAAAECFAAFRRAGRRPATLLGLVATIAVMVAAYAKGVAAIPLVLVLVVVASMVWYLAGAERGSPVEGITTTVFGFAWVGLLGSFAALMLAPSLYPDRHGIAFLIGAVVATVGADVGALVVGTWLGRHPLAPTVSPHKTWEGLVGGTVLAIVVSAAVTGQVHPWTPGKAAVLGLVAAVVAPLGDLCESLVKRDLGLKDMGSLLPGHGGVLDRFDGLLFVLPATYYLVRVLHLG